MYKFQQFEIDAARKKQDAPSGVEHGLLSFVDGFANKATHPDAVTASSAAIGFGAGLGVKAAHNNPLLLGGVVGKIGKLAPLAIPIALAGETARRWDGEASLAENSRIAGGVTFDVVVGGGAALVGMKAGDLPGLRRLVQPRALTELPQGIKYTVYGDTAIVKALRGNPWNRSDAVEFQVRLANGQGFGANNRLLTQKVSLRPMPEKLGDGTQLTYRVDGTTVRRTSGTEFVQNLDDSVEATVGGARVRKFPNGTLTTSHPDGTIASHLSTGEKQLTVPGQFHISENPAYRATSKIHQDGWAETWRADGSYEHKSVFGRHRLVVNAQQEATYTFTRGSDRALRGMGGPRVRSAKLQEDVHQLGKVELVEGSPKFNWSPQLPQMPFHITPKPKLPSPPELPTDMKPVDILMNRSPMWAR